MLLPPGWRLYAWVFAFAAFVRLAYVLQITDTLLFGCPVGDGFVYDRWAVRISQGHWLGEEIFGAAPLYPYFLASLYAAFGHDLLIVRVVQCLLGAASSVLLSAAGSRFFSPRVGTVAGLLLAVYAPALFFDGLIQKSSLDLFLTCLLLCVLARMGDSPERGWFVAGGATLGGLALTRENALILAPLLGLWILRRPEGGPTRGRWACLAAFGAGLLIVLLPVGARNRLVGGEFHLTTANLGGNLYLGNNERADGRYVPLRTWRDHAPSPRLDSVHLLAEGQDALELAEEALGHRPGPGEASRYWTDRVLRFVREHPGAWMRLTVRKCLLIWNSKELADSEEPEAYCDHSLVLRTLWPISHFGVLAPLAIAGMVLWRRSKGRLMPLYMILLGLTASIALFYVLARYRYPMVPVLALFASAFLCGVVERCRSRDFRSLELPVYVLAVAIPLVNWKHFPEDKPRAITFYNLGVSLSLQGRSVDAIESFARALEVTPEMAQARFNRAKELCIVGRLDEGVAEFRRVLVLMPGNASAHSCLAKALAALGLDDEAAEHSRRALEAAGEHSKAGAGIR
jgi:tetratricopeptide (TPR) repeat protein